ncbi:MAG: nodulation protein NfeD [Chloroflexota bacterium]
MRRVTFLALGLVVWLGSLPGSAQTERQILVLTASGPLTPALVEYLDRGLSLAERQGAEALILTLDTPGGQVEHMNRMIQSIRGSSIPVVIYVSPRGAIAGSAGTVIALAGHVAAMAPETAIGAASPVGGQGEDLGETIERKVKEILKAEARGLAERRGADAVALAEATIEEAKAVSASEALEAGLIDFIANDLEDLRSQLDGFEVQMQSGPRSLQTSGAELVELNQTFIEQLLGTLTNPNIVFLLMAIGVQSILIEISSPGGWVAGFIGVVSLALGAFGLGVLPVNWAGLIFLLTAFVLFILDIKAPTHGALTVAGAVSFIAGALILFNSPGTPAFQRVSVPLVVGTALLTSAVFLTIVMFAISAQRRRVEVGSEALVGRMGVAKTELAPTGMVQVGGELWSAQVEDRSAALRAGQDVEVIGVDGLRLRVRARDS